MDSQTGRKFPARLDLFESGNLTPIIHLTVCTHKRKPILATDDVHQLLATTWSQPTNHWRVGRYTILPDHIHLFCSPASHESLHIRRWADYWKTQASNHWPRPDEHPVWQIDGWDTQLRSGDSYGAKWEYVRNNPVRHNLATAPEDWPYQGELNYLEWHDQ